MCLYHGVMKHHAAPLLSHTARPNLIIRSFIGRVGCSHANCVENLPLFATVILVNAVMSGTPDISKQAWYYVAARVAQGVTHWTSVSDAAVTIRFVCFFVSMVLLISMGYTTMS